MSAPQLTLYFAESGLNYMKLIVLMEEVSIPWACISTVADIHIAWSLLQVGRYLCHVEHLLTFSSSEVILDLAKEEHKTEEYRKLNPNGRIPTLVDHSNNDEVIWESNAILKYIAERYDTDRKLLVTDEKEKADLDTCAYLSLLHRLSSDLSLQGSSTRLLTKVPLSVTANGSCSTTPSASLLPS